MTKSKYLSLLAILYFGLSLFGILRHELWLDESHHWLLSRDSGSLSELIANTRYEGHPILWNILLFLISRFTLNPVSMQLLHIVISTAAVCFFLRKAPFSPLFKTLFIFGYFMFFEYNLISRNYILGVLLLFVACWLYGKRRTHFVWLCAVLALATNVHLMFAVIAFALLLTLLVENFTRQFDRRSVVIGCGVFAGGLALLALQVIPPPDNNYFSRLDQVAPLEKFVKGFISFFKGLVTIPDFRTIHFWNSNLVVNASKPLAGILGILVYFIPVLLFRKKITLFFVYSALFGAQVFFYVLQLGATRYDGMTFLVIIVALWIDSVLPEDQFKWTGFMRPVRLRKPVVYAILLIQFFSGWCAYAFDFRLPFSTAKQAVTYAKTEHLDTAQIVTVTCDGTLISPYLEKKIWFLCNGEENSFCQWQRVCADNIAESTIIDKLAHYIKNHKYAVYISCYPIGDTASHDWTQVGKLKIRYRKKTGESIVRNNSLYIYEVATPGYRVKAQQ